MLQAKGQVVFVDGAAGQQASMVLRGVDDKTLGDILAREGVNATPVAGDQAPGGQVRMARGLSLVQLAERTRIGVKHLENVEGDRYDALPVGVYLRGILMNLARALGLDGLRVSKSYLTFVEAHRSKG